VRLFNSVEAAARQCLSDLLGRDERPALRSVAALDRAGLVPDMQLVETTQVPLTNSWVVQFAQTSGAIPVFGSKAVVELDANRELLSVDAQLGDVRDISTQPAIGAHDALNSIRVKAGMDALADPVTPASLVFFNDEEKDEWHLAYHFRSVAAMPRGFVEGLRSHGTRAPSVNRARELEYLVDAHDGEVLA
jgi:hypothetical protein